ncbi:MULTISPECIES: VOC family protein [Lonsdalea]|uniref:Metal-binding protein n=2 Tax=Lonsdalea TaxID=1082702 RepID=A0ACD1JCZ7_9GAMM|nr:MULTISPECIES: VOC family protein [Lonsdalea]OSN01532.1 metal-binding protein [Lonsdalea populi]QPQ22817.1 VOC family protein [Lonsdalea populi]RAT14121.1 metal-binding protein [Lonsdalea quercina]RAT20738.1 metal-binding protein [Lonsdalea populi]RAT24799.1 metal-binding protein [Lonsdalea populi]
MAANTSQPLPASLIADLSRFESEMDKLAEQLSLDIAQFEADHISLRCHQNATAERWREALLAQGATLMSENMINGRPICLFTLPQPITVGPWQIACIELPWPGNKRYPHEGWEHVEVVLPGDPATLHQRALACLPDEALLTQGICLKFSQPQGEQERLPNPTLAVTNGAVTLKFHPFSLQDIVESERDGDLLPLLGKRAGR